MRCLFFLLLACIQHVTGFPAEWSDLRSSDLKTNNLTFLQLPVKNLSMVNIPKDFKIGPVVMPTRMPMSRDGDSYNTIMALAEVALGDYNEAMYTRAFSSRRFPSLRLVVHAPSQSSIDRKYVVWGLYLSLLWLTEKPLQEFQLFFVILSWQGRKVGGIEYRPYPGSPGDHANETEAAERRIMPSTTTTLVTNSTLREPSNEPHLSVDFQSYGNPLDRELLLRSIGHAVADTASMPARTTLVEPWASITRPAPRF